MSYKRKENNDNNDNNDNYDNYVDLEIFVMNLGLKYEEEDFIISLLTNGSYDSFFHLKPYDLIEMLYLDEYHNKNIKFYKIPEMFLNEIICIQYIYDGGNIDLVPYFCLSVEIYEELLYKDIENIHQIPKNFINKDMSEFLLIEGNKYLSFIPNIIYEDEDIFYKIVYNNKRKLKNIPHSLKKNIKFLKKIIMMDHDNITYLDNDLITKELIFEILNEKPEMIIVIPNEFLAEHDYLFCISKKPSLVMEIDKKYITEEMYSIVFKSKHNLIRYFELKKIKDYMYIESFSKEIDMIDEFGFENILKVNESIISKVLTKNNKFFNKIPKVNMTNELILIMYKGDDESYSMLGKEEKEILKVLKRKSYLDLDGMSVKKILNKINVVEERKKKERKNMKINECDDMVF